eukprot:scaffold4172_cov212-Alexandrium_tamarense.AAC.19
MTSADDPSAEENHPNQQVDEAPVATAEAVDDKPTDGQVAIDESTANNNNNNNNTSSDDDESRPSDAVQPSSKKRRSNIQISKDETEIDGSDEDDDDGELNDEGGKRSDPFKRAPEEVLKGRKIVKASKKWGGGSGGGSVGGGGGAFASVNLVAPSKSTEEVKTGESSGSGAAAPSVFGSTAKIPTFGSTIASSTTSGLGTASKSTFGSGFGSVASGFGAVNAATSKDADKDSSAAPTKSLFGGGFGAVSSGFGAVKSTNGASGFGSSGPKASDTKTDEATAPTSTNGSGGLGGTFANLSKSSSSSNTTPTPSFPTQSAVDIANGEENEECLCQIRAKLFKMAPVQEKGDDEGEDGSGTNAEAVPSVPSTSGRMELKKDGDEKKEDTKESRTATSGETKNAPLKMDWHEAGIGPVRVLKSKPTLSMLGVLSKNNDEKEEKKSYSRVVQRRETVPGGHGTKLILNALLIPNLCQVHRKSDKCIQLDAPNSGDEDNSGRALGSYLFRVKTAVEADTLQSNLEKMLLDEDKA